MSLPDITATGNLAADPELKFFNDGNSVANFRIGCGARRKNHETGQWEDAGTTWLTCVARDGLAENIVTKFAKGQKIFVKGQLKQREYEKDGQKRTVFEVNVSPTVSGSSGKDPPITHTHLAMVPNAVEERG